MVARFKDELQAALDKFDIRRAEALSDKIHDAEERGYEITATEERLWAKLTKCVESYRRSLCFLD